MPSSASRLNSERVNSTVTRASSVEVALLIFGPGTSTRNICTSPRPRSSSSKTSLSCARAGTSAWKRSIAVSISSCVEAISPRYWLAVAEEASGRAIVGQRREPDGGIGALLDRSGGRGADHVGAHPARAHHVDLHIVLVPRQRPGQRVEGRLGDAICGAPSIHVGELSRAAR